MPLQIRIQLLSNRPNVELNGADIHIPDSSLDLLIYLAAENLATHDRDALTVRLYESLDFRDSLRQTALGYLPKPIKDLCIRSTRQTIHYDNTHVHVDIHEFQQLVEAIPENHSTTAFRQMLPQLVKASELYEADFLSDYSPALYGLNPWMREKRTTFRTLYHRLLEKLIQYEIAAQHYNAALTYAERWHDNDRDANLPLQYLIWLTANLDAHSLMEFYLERLKRIDTTRQGVIGYSPPEWRRLFDRGMKPNVSALRLNTTARIEVQELLDLASSYLTGRASPLEEVFDVLFVSQSSSLLTITGERGIGKTALAETVAAVCRETELVKQAIYVGVTLATDFEQILNAVAIHLERTYLLELDYRQKYLNIEQLLQEHDYLLILDQQEVGEVYTDDLKKRVVQLSENVRVLVCAHAAWEEVQNVPLTPLTDAITAELFAGYLDINQDFQNNASAVIEVTGGVPLRIKLLARSILAQNLSIGDAVSRLQSGEQPLLHWCWQILDISARRVLTSLTDFDLLEGPTLAELQRLHADLPVSTVAAAAKQLAAMALIEPVGDHYRWHSLVADFLRDIDAVATDDPQIKTQRREAFCKLHFEYLTQYADDHPQLDARQRNLLRAFDIAFEQGTVVLSDVNRFAPYLLARGLYNPARDLFTQAEQAVPNPAPNDLIELLVNTAKLDKRQGEYEAGKSRLSKALVLAERHDETVQLGEICQELGVFAKMAGNYPMAHDLHQQTLKTARDRGNSQLISITLANLGMTSIEQGQYLEGKKYLQESMEIALTLNQSIIIEFAQNALSIIAIEERKFDQALEYLTQAQSIALSLGRIERLGYIFLNIGAAHYYLGHYEIAEDSFQEGLAIANRLEHDDLKIRLTRNFGRIKAIKGNFVEAEQLYKTALVKLADTTTATLQVSVLLDLGKLYFQQHHLAHAQRCFQKGLEQAWELQSFDLASEAVLSLAYTTANDHWLIGPDDPQQSIILLRENWEPFLLARLDRWPITAEQLQKAAFFFEYGLLNFPDIQRYRIVEAVIHLIGLAKT